MALAIFPTSPLPANLSRTRNWNDDVVTYDSGMAQGLSTFVRPLFIFNIPYRNVSENQQGSLTNFIDTVKNGASPFLMKDAIEFRVNSNLAVGAAVTDADTLQLFDTRSFFIRADTTTIGSLFSADSGYVRLGVEYNYEQDTGLLSVVTKDVGDVWGVRSLQYYRKCRFVRPYTDTAIIWNQFSFMLAVKEEV